MSSISSRPSEEQVIALIDFMDKNPDLAFGRLKCAPRRAESKKLWFKLTRILNSLSGPTRPMKSWIKFWADKKAHVRNKVQSQSTGCQKTILTAVDQTIWEKFLADENDSHQTNARMTLKQENGFQDGVMDCAEESRINDAFHNDLEIEIHPVHDHEDRYMDIMNKLVNIMEDQSTSLATMAQASESNKNAMEELAKASLLQARAVKRLANSITAASSFTQHISNSLVGINSTMNRMYPGGPT